MPPTPVPVPPTLKAPFTSAAEPVDPPSPMPRLVQALGMAVASTTSVSVAVWLNVASMLDGDVPVSVTE